MSAAVSTRMRNGFLFFTLGLLSAYHPEINDNSPLSLCFLQSVGITADAHWQVLQAQKCCMAKTVPRPRLPAAGVWPNYRGAT